MEELKERIAREKLDQVKYVWGRKEGREKGEIGRRKRDKARGGRGMKLKERRGAEGGGRKGGRPDTGNKMEERISRGGRRYGRKGRRG